MALPLVTAASIFVNPGVAKATSYQGLSYLLNEGFSALVFGDLNTQGGDTEGRLLVGGDMNVDGSYSVGTCTSGTEICEDSLYNLSQSNGERHDLIVGGDLSGSASWAMENGNAYIGGDLDSGVSIDGVNGNQVYSGDPMENLDNVLDKAYEQVLNLTSDLTEISAGTTGTVTDNGYSLVLKGDDPYLNIFNVTAEQWGGSGKTRYIDVPQGSQVVINVDGETVDISGGTIYYGEEGCMPEEFGIPTAPVCEDPLDYSPNTIVNYYEATTVNISAFDHEATMLAPMAELNASGGSVNGTSVVASANTSNGFEFHYRPDEEGEDGGNGDSSERVPEPNATFSLLALGVVCLLIRRQKQL